MIVGNRHSAPLRSVGPITGSARIQNLPVSLHRHVAALDDAFAGCQIVELLQAVHPQPHGVERGDLLGQEPRGPFAAVGRTRADPGAIGRLPDVLPAELRHDGELPQPAAPAAPAERQEIRIDDRIGQLQPGIPVVFRLDLVGDRPDDRPGDIRALPRSGVVARPNRPLRGRTSVSSRVGMDPIVAHCPGHAVGNVDPDAEQENVPGPHAAFEHAADLIPDPAADPGRSRPTGLPHTCDGLVLGRGLATAGGANQTVWRDRAARRCCVPVCRKFPCRRPSTPRGRS